MITSRSREHRQRLSAARSAPVHRPGAESQQSRNNGPSPEVTFARAIKDAGLGDTVTPADGRLHLVEQRHEDGDESDNG